MPTNLTDPPFIAGRIDTTEFGEKLSGFPELQAMLAGASCALEGAPIAEGFPQNELARVIAEDVWKHWGRLQVIRTFTSRLESRRGKVA